LPSLHGGACIGTVLFAKTLLVKIVLAKRTVVIAA
jgi:hypothetical protein